METDQEHFLPNGLLTDGAEAQVTSPRGNQQLLSLESLKEGNPGLGSGDRSIDDSKKKSPESEWRLFLKREQPNPQITSNLWIHV